MNTLEKVELNNPNLIKLLKNAFDQNKVSHAFIFAATNGVEIINEPHLLINSIIENDITDIDHFNYSDLTIIDGTSGLIKKEMVTNAINKMSTSTLDARGYKILFIKNIENGNKQSLNSLLKFIEEPQDKTYIIMTTNKLGGVLNTIRSRSQVVNVKAPNKELIAESLNDIEEPFRSIVAEISKSPKEAKDFWKSKKNKEFLENLIDLFDETAGNKYDFQIGLNKLLNKNNYNIVVFILRVFINDIWRCNSNQKTMTGLQNTLKKYRTLKYKEILEALSEFVRTLNQFGNFELAKTRLLLEIGENYE